MVGLCRRKRFQSKKVNVLLIHQGDYGWGGGQTQLNRLQSGLIKAGVEAKILCKTATRKNSVAIPRWQRLESYLGRITQRLGLNDIHCLSSFTIPKSETYQNADVLDFHCIHSGFFSYLALPRLTEGKPAVFTLHDMWPFTGHCHNSLDCERWKIGCGRCPYPEVAPAVRRDATHWEWKLKNWVYQHSKFTIVVPSRWLMKQAEQSILDRFPIHHIPHGIDTEVYKPLNRNECCSVLGIPPGKKVLLFVVDDFERRLKGGDLLQEALQSLPGFLKTQTVLLLLGKNSEALAQTVGIQTLNLGYVGGDRLKIICFSAADLFILPTRADNFPLTLLESLACGTPIVSFGVGGVPDVVRPGITGYLAEPENVEDLRNGIVQLLEDHRLRERMSENCRAIALKEYRLELQVERYMNLYSQLVKNGARKAKVA